MGWARLYLNLPTLLQHDISMFFAVLRSAAASPESIVTGIISWTLSFVVWWGSNGPSEIPVIIMLLPS